MVLISSPSLASKMEIHEVKPQDIVEIRRVIAMLKKWATCSFMALNEEMLTMRINDSQSYPQKLWSDSTLH